MRKNLILLAAILYVAVASAQDSKKVFGASTLVWYGIDFTKAKMVGFKDESPHTIRDQYFHQWNDMTTNMDLAKVFQKSAVYKDPKGITKIDAERETDALVSNDDADLSADAIAEAVKEVPLGQKKEGVGVIFLVQSFNKTTQMGSVYVTFFDIANHAVLLSKKVTGKAAGGNTVAAWTGALKNIFTAVEKKEFSAWKKEANY
jgi:hypothetical protein